MEFTQTHKHKLTQRTRIQKYEYIRNNSVELITSNIEVTAYCSCARMKNILTDAVYPLKNKMHFISFSRISLASTSFVFDIFIDWTIGMATNYPIHTNVRNSFTIEC